MGGPRAFALVFVVLVLALMVVALGPGLLGQSPVSPLPSGLPFNRLVHGQSLLIAGRGHRVIQTAEAWQAFWAEAGLPGEPLDIDFRTSLVVAVLMGQRATGGHDIRVTSVLRLGPEVLLALVESSAGTGCTPTPGPTQPFDIVALPAGSGQVLPLYRSEKPPC